MASREHGRNTGMLSADGIDVAESGHGLHERGGKRCMNELCGRRGLEILHLNRRPVWGRPRLVPPGNARGTGTRGRSVGKQALTK